MKFFNSKKSEDTSAEIFKALRSLNTLHQIDLTSESIPVLIFKHSTRCGKSSMVLRRFKEIAKAYENQLSFYYLDLLNYRDISNTIAEKYDVIHQSPQILIIKNGTAVTNASHYNILEINFQRIL